MRKSCSLACLNIRADSKRDALGYLCYFKRVREAGSEEGILRDAEDLGLTGEASERSAV